MAKERGQELGGSRGGSRPGAGRPKSGRDDTSVKIDRGIVAMAKLVADARKTTVAELVSEMLREPMQREFDIEVARLKGDQK